MTSFIYDVGLATMSWLLLKGAHTAHLYLRVKTRVAGQVTPGTPAAERGRYSGCSVKRRLGVNHVTSGIGNNVQYCNGAMVPLHQCTIATHTYGLYRHELPTSIR